MLLLLHIAPRDRGFDRLLATLSAMALRLPLALAALLVATLALLPTARANDGCTGQDLVAAMRQSAPAQLAAIERKAAETPNGRGVFWKIERDGLAPSYLLGTIHLTDPRVLGMPKGATEAHAAARVIVIESDEILDETKAATALLARPELTMFTDGSTISDLLSPEEAAQLAEGLKSRGIALPLVERMKPWMIASFVSLPPCEFTRKAEGASFLDKKIAEDALAAGKPVKGLETLAEQLEAMAALPVRFHLDALNETLALGRKMDDAVETMIGLYLKGDVGMIMPVLESLSPEKNGGDGSYAAFEQRIILDRNAVMAERALPMLAEGGAFIAVGALHLPGEQGVIALLRKAGYKVTPVTAEN